MIKPGSVQSAAHQRGSVRTGAVAILLRAVAWAAPQNAISRLISPHRNVSGAVLLDKSVRKRGLGIGQISTHKARRITAAVSLHSASSRSAAISLRTPALAAPGCAAFSLP